MKNFIKHIILVILAPALFSCSVKESSTAVMKYAGDTDIDFPGQTPSARKIVFMTDSRWRIELGDGASWLQANPDNGGADGKLETFIVTLSPEPNVSPQRRECGLKIVYGGNQSLTLNISQKGVSPLAPCTQYEITGDMIFSSACSYYKSTVQQSFGYDAVGGDVYFVQRAHLYKNVISWTSPEFPAGDEIAKHHMDLCCFSHGNNVVFENTTGNEIYVWAPNFGSRESDGYYGNPNVVSRFKLEEGSSIYNTDPGDNYYFGICPCWPAIDFKDGLFAICDCHNVYVYSLSELQTLPKTSVTLEKKITYGGISSNGKSTYDSGLKEYTGFPTITAHDCRTVAPLRKFAIDYRSRGLHWQTFCIANGRAYFLLQADPDEAGPIVYDTYVEVYDLKTGVLLFPKVRQEYMQNKQRLVELGFVEENYCYAEPEGIDVVADTMYIMYTCRGKEAITTRRPVVFKLSAEFQQGKGDF